MRSKSPLILMEQLVMVLVFTLAAALCLKMFVAADARSKQYAMIDRAVLEAQTAAERLKQGSLTGYLEKQNAAYENGVWQLALDEDWTPASGGAKTAFYLRVTEEDSGHAYLWRARISVQTADGTALVELPVSGQKSWEVADRG